MKIFISGGCKNGKSTLAESCAHMLARGGKLYYIATMIPHDEEDRERIRNHIAQRAGKGFVTIEQGRGLKECLKKADAGGTFLLDSVTALLSNEMFRDGIVDGEAVQRTARDLACFAKKVRHAVFVSDFIFADGGEYDAYTEAYRRGLALCDRTLTAICDTAVEVSVGQTMLYKGNLPSKEEETWI